MEIRGMQELTDLLKTRGLKLSTAESCTGGLLGSALTEAPGATSFYLGGAVAYSNDAKERLLGVSHATLVSKGAVSEEAAREMAEGARLRIASDLAVAVTGIAGPSGGTMEKPVGLVYVAVSDGERTVAPRNIFLGSRQRVRRESAEEAVRVLIGFLLGAGR
jgi:PncC family amidohydrolase